MVVSAKPALRDISIQVEITNRPAGIWRLFGLPQRLLEFLLQKIAGMFLGFDRLAKYGIAPTVLLFHGAGSIVKIVEHLGLDRSDVRDNSLAFGVNSKDGTATRAGQIEVALLWHLEKSYPKAGYSVRIKMDGKDVEGKKQLPTQHQK